MSEQSGVREPVHFVCVLVCENQTGCLDFGLFEGEGTGSFCLLCDVITSQRPIAVAWISAFFFLAVWVSHTC